MGVKERQDEPDKSGDLRSKKRLYRKVVWQQDIDGGNKEAKKQKGVLCAILSTVHDGGGSFWITILSGEDVH